MNDDRLMPTHEVEPAGAGPWGSIIAGAWRFTLVSVGGFGVWAFAGRWFYTHLGEAGLYAATTVVFLGLSGLLLHPLVPGPGAIRRLYRVFVPAFVGYAIAWCLMWFLFGGRPGEWLGSLAGSVAFVALTGWGLGHPRPFAPTAAVFFVAHSAGYFAGGFLMSLILQSHGDGPLGGLSKDWVGVLAKLAWGCLYGLGFGVGLGYAFHACQRGGRPGDQGSGSREQ